MKDLEIENKYVYKTYNEIAKDFDDTRFCRWNSVRLFLDSLEKYSLIADIGCGNGKYMKYKQNELFYIGNDTSIELLNIFNQKMNNITNIILANGIQLPYKNNSFDAVISIAVLHHIYKPENRLLFISELIRICKPNGIIHITVWADTINKKKCKSYGEIAGDYLISWKNKYSRYYHLFNKDEIINMMDNYKNITYELIYEMENWCITIKN
jgi:tRNA (uracil-5-)-methyltransferase TRM9